MDISKLPPNTELSRLYKLALERSSAGDRTEAFDLFSLCLDHPGATNLFRAIVLFLLSLEFKSNGLHFVRAGMHLLSQYARDHPDQLLDPEYLEAEKDSRDLLKFHNQRATTQRAAARKEARKDRAAGFEDSDDDEFGIKSPMQKLALGTEIEGRPTTANGNIFGGEVKQAVRGRVKV
ncbi:hypothetical protein LTR84_004047 [Exophiala bonariae]|uniref:Uncharacterized protein n=1 Tax=Exophiala bonariae TaxID=1690606 RepID=A0AAV9N5K2_9EURO|nr:hypothetical protein LTR84_004047 [Exophiala bonariae]